MRNYDCFGYDPKFKGACRVLKEPNCEKCAFYKTRKELKEQIKKALEKNT